MAEDISSALGADILIGGGDMALAGNGDIALVANLDMVSQRLYLKATPDKGSVLLHPDLGIGLASAVQTPLSQEGVDRLAGDMSTLAAADPAITSVDDVVIDQPAPRALQVTPVVTLVGGLTTALPLNQARGA